MSHRKWLWQRQLVLPDVQPPSHSGWTLVTSAGQWPVSDSVTCATSRLKQLQAGESPLFLATCLSDLEHLGGWPGYGSKNGLPALIGLWYEREVITHEATENSWFICCVLIVNYSAQSIDRVNWNNFWFTSWGFIFLTKQYRTKRWDKKDTYLKNDPF